jgi:hypothetical protein
MRPTFEAAQLGSAEILHADGSESLGVNKAMGKIRAVISTTGLSTSRNFYAVVVHRKSRDQSRCDHLKTFNTLIKAYWRGWRTLSQLANTQRPSPSANHIRTIRDQEAGDVCIYWGRASAKTAEKTIRTSPGFYVIPSHLDLVGLGLPPIPEPFRESPLVIQVTTDTSRDREKQSENWNPWESLTRLITGEDQTTAEIERDTLEWRNQFLSEYKCWTSAQVAKETTSTAKNRAAIASRWLAEGRIFSVRFNGKTWFPRFQFHNGSPIPAVCRVIKAFPKHTSGWDLAFFFTTSNSFIGGRKPLELLKGDPETLESLAQSFASPADAF